VVALTVQQVEEPSGGIVIGVDEDDDKDEIGVPIKTNEPLSTSNQFDSIFL
jgi:hypothetical protein